MFLLFKTLHLFFMTTWFAGLLYLPRLYVYHSLADDKISIERFKIMERKLFWGIATPSGVLTVIFGAMTILTSQNPAYYMISTWMQIKLAAVSLLILFHLWCFQLMKSFREERNIHNHKWYRWFNEFPTIILIVVIALTVYKF